VAAVPYLWVLWDLWNTEPNPLRTSAPGNFYDLQARAMMHGHLYLANNSIGIEGFIHNGHTFTYFNIFPSLIRMPILLLTSSLDGQLTNLSLLSAWIFTALFTSLLIWRVRILLRGDAALGRAEAGTLGILVASVLGGTVLVFLASTPYVYNEDLAWSVGLTIGTVFALLGVLERPTRGRVIASFVFVLAASLDRVPTGWGCVLGALLVAGWFATGRGGSEYRRWALPMVAVGLIPFIAGCVVNFAKFGVPLGLPMQDQVWTQVNAHRRYFLAVNGGKNYGLQFLPSTLLAYFGPGGIRFTSAFPFVTLPAAPAQAIGGVVIDRAYRTASLTVTTPLLFCLACWGVISSFLPRRPRAVKMLRIALVATAVGGGAMLIWGYIATRFLADWVPFLVVGAIVGAIDIWSRIARWRPESKALVLVLTAALGLFSIVANVGMSITPTEEFNSTQIHNFVSTQESISRLTGLSLKSEVMHGNHLPNWAPADELYVLGDCSDLYISNGEDYSTVPKQQFEHVIWQPVERGPGTVQELQIKFVKPLAALGRGIPILTLGTSTLFLRPVGSDQIRFALSDPHWPDRGMTIRVHLNTLYPVTIVTDLNLRTLQVNMEHRLVFRNPISGQGTAFVHDSTGLSTLGSPVSIVSWYVPTPRMPLCRFLLKNA